MKKETPRSEAGACCVHPWGAGGSHGSLVGETAVEGPPGTLLCVQAASAEPSGASAGYPGGGGEEGTTGLWPLLTRLCTPARCLGARRPCGPVWVAPQGCGLLWRRIGTLRPSL